MTLNKKTSLNTVGYIFLTLVFICGFIFVKANSDFWFIYWLPLMLWMGFTAQIIGKKISNNRKYVLLIDIIVFIVIYFVIETLSSLI